MKLSYIAPVLGLAIAVAGYAAVQATTAPASCCDGDDCATQPAKSGSVLMLADVGTPATSTAPAAVDVGNTKCVIEVDQEASETVTYTYNGKVYHFCCSDCIADFKKDPEKYAKALSADPAKWGIKK